MNLKQLFNESTKDSPHFHEVYGKDFIEWYNHDGDMTLELALKLEEYTGIDNKIWFPRISKNDRNKMITSNLHLCLCGHPYDWKYMWKNIHWDAMSCNLCGRKLFKDILKCVKKSLTEDSIMSSYLMTQE